MREYRKRKRVAQVSASVSRTFSASSVCTPERSRGPQRITGLPNPPKRSQTVFVALSTRSDFKGALELAPTFPFGMLSSRVCPYCYNLLGLYRQCSRGKTVGSGGVQAEHWR